MVPLSRPATTNHVHHVFPTQQTYATDFFLKLWYDFIEKCILQTLLRQTLVQAIKNMPGDNFILE